MIKNFKKRISCFILALFSVFTLIPAMPTMAAENYSDGGWNQMQNTATVSLSGGGTGTVYAGEGVTVLYFSGNSAFIEYSASSKPKQGFVNKSALRYINKYNQTAVGRVTSSCTTYYSPSTTYYAGSVSSGELVSVLCKSGNWAYVEYNVSGGLRKRAFMPASNLSYYSSNIRGSFYHEGVSGLRVPINSNKTVFAGPNGNTYSQAGEIYTGDDGKVYSYATFTDGNGRSMLYVSYPAGNSTKYGYIYAN